DGSNPRPVPAPISPGALHCMLDCHHPSSKNTDATSVWCASCVKRQHPSCSSGQRCLKHVFIESTRSTSRKISAHFLLNFGRLCSKYPALKLHTAIAPYFAMFSRTSGKVPR